MDNAKQETSEFLWRRLTEECPTWAIGVPVLFALLVLALVVIFRPDRKLLTGLIGGAVVGVIAFVYLPIAFFLVKHFNWIVILIPVMGVALFYVGMMYIRDARSVHWLWAVFLGSLRTTVYIILAVVFLLPGCQHSERQEYPSKVVFLFDISGSMYVVDDLPKEGEKLEDMDKRQDKILRFLLSSTDPDGRDQVPFIERVRQKSLVTAYRFGPFLDETDIVNLDAKNDLKLSDEKWGQFLKPEKKYIADPIVEGVSDEVAKANQALYNKRVELVDTMKSGTNIGLSCLQAHKIENSSYVQAIIVISDGQANVGNDDARTDFLARVNSAKRPIPVITVGVGEYRLPSAIRIDDLQAPEETRPDDSFPVRVPVIGTNLLGQKFTVTLEVTRVKDVTGKPVKEKTHILGPEEGTFKGKDNADHPQDLVQFAVDVQKLMEIKASDKENAIHLEGEWQIVARVPRHKQEGEGKDHVTAPIKVQVQKRALKVLLFASGATREYQFVRTVLYRETLENRMEMCIYNQQTAHEEHIDQDVPKERMLEDFPTRLGPPGADKFMSLNDHDVVICFDPDWSKLTTSQLKNLKTWVERDGGGVIFVAGPVHSYQLATAGGRDISALKAIFPVVLQDNRLHGLKLGDGMGSHDPTRPYALQFSPAANQFDFLRIDESEDNPSPTAGWNKFFWGDEKYSPNPYEEKPRKGFTTYYPVKELRAATQVAAIFAGSKEGRIGGKTDSFIDGQPFFASMVIGGGKTLYVGSGETWRLRIMDGYHERLWIKMARYVAAGTRERKKYGRILMARNLPVGMVNFEAQIKGKDLLPLPETAIPTVLVKRIGRKLDEGGPDPKDKEKKGEPVEDKTNVLTFTLKSKSFDEDYQGYFTGSVQIKEPGEYEFLLPIPGVDGEYLKQNLVVRKKNIEMDNVRTNFDYLYQLASEAPMLLKNLPPETQKEIEDVLQAPEGTPSTQRSAKRLFFQLKSADKISKCLMQLQPKSESVKGRFEDLWDDGVVSKYQFSIFWAVLIAPLIIGLVGVLILALLKQWISAAVFFGLCVVVSVLAVLFSIAPIETLFLTGGLLGMATLGFTIYLAIKQEIVSAITLIVFAGFVAAGIAVLFWYMPAGTTEKLSLSIREDYLPLGFSFLMVAAVSLVGVEWLTRKLLRLA